MALFLMTPFLMAHCSNYLAPRVLILIYNQPNVSSMGGRRWHFTLGTVGLQWGHLLHPMHLTQTTKPGEAQIEDPPALAGIAAAAHTLPKVPPLFPQTFCNEFSPFYFLSACSCFLDILMSMIQGRVNSWKFYYVPIFVLFLNFTPQIGQHCLWRRVACCDAQAGAGTMCISMHACSFSQGSQPQALPDLPSPPCRSSSVNGSQDFPLSLSITHRKLTLTVCVSNKNKTNKQRNRNKSKRKLLVPPIPAIHTDPTKLQGQQVMRGGCHITQSPYDSHVAQTRGDSPLRGGAQKTQLV